jgi:hypothetical protein
MGLQQTPNPIGNVVAAVGRLGHDSLISSAATISV